MVHRIQEYKPNMKKGGSPVDASDAKPALAYDSNSDIIMFSEQSWVSIVTGWLKSAFLFLLSAVLIFGVIYTTLAATLFYANLVDNKIVLVARGTFLGGEPNLDDFVYTSATVKASDDIVTRLSNAFFGVPEAQVVNVRSQLLDTVSAGNGTITVNGKSFAGSILDNKGQPMSLNSEQLSNQYVVQCVIGACQPNSFLLMSKDAIFGEVKNVKTLKE